jgi:hypothetical protein
MIFSGPGHVHVYICIVHVYIYVLLSVCLSCLIDSLKSIYCSFLSGLPLHPTSLYIYCFLYVPPTWIVTKDGILISQCMSSCRTTGHQMMPFLFSSEATHSLYFSCFLIVVNSYKSWEYRLLIFKGKYFLAYVKLNSHISWEYRLMTFQFGKLLCSNIILELSLLLAPRFMPVNTYMCQYTLFFCIKLEYLGSC